MSYTNRRAFTLLAVIVFLLSYSALKALEAKHQYSRIIKTNRSEIQERFQKEVIYCKDLATCNLKKGDMLIRRHVTKRTYIFNELLNPYFTHTALYIGEGKIVEASGVEYDRKDDISIKNLSETDWLDKDIEALAIIRITGYKEIDFDNDIKKISAIAEDQNHVFGFEKGEISCAELLYRNISYPLFKKVPIEMIVTPDYLFKILTDQGALVVRIK